jgi:hypothetical protein
MDKQLFFYLFLLVKLKENTKSKVVDTKYLKEEISRIVVRKGGFPKRMVKYLINDLVKLGLITRKNKVNLYILNESNAEKKVKNLIEFA